MNRYDLDKEIDKNFIRRIRYFTKQPDTIEFAKPEKFSGWNVLSHDEVLTKLPDGSTGNPKTYYIPKEEYNQVLKILKEFKIPETLYPDLIWAYLNMSLGACNSMQSDDFSKTLNERNKELYDTLNLLEDIVTGKKKLTGFTFETKDGAGKIERLSVRKVSRTRNEKLLASQAVNFLNNVLMMYKESKNFDVLTWGYNHVKKYGESDMNFGHKNARQQKQDYYAWAIYQHLRQELFQSCYVLVQDWSEFLKCRKQMLKTYSQRKRFHLIGKLMQLSGLLETKDNAEDEELIDRIKKKLGRTLNAEKQKNLRIRKQNAESTDGRYEAVNLASLF